MGGEEFGGGKDGGGGGVAEEGVADGLFGGGFLADVESAGLGAVEEDEFAGAGGEGVGGELESGEGGVAAGVADDGAAKGGWKFKFLGEQNVRAGGVVAGATDKDKGADMGGAEAGGETGESGGDGLAAHLENGVEPEGDATGGGDGGGGEFGAEVGGEVSVDDAGAAEDFFGFGNVGVEGGEGVAPEVVLGEAEGREGGFEGEEEQGKGKCSVFGVPRSGRRGAVRNAGQAGLGREGEG
jgi:hypothetical protein